MRAPLHRKLFFMMGLAIFVTVGVSGTVAHLISEKTMHGNLPTIREFFSEQFAQVWHDPAERSALAEKAAHAFHVSLELRDTSGSLLSSHGEDCFGPRWNFPARQGGDGGTGVGDITVCAGSHAQTEKKALMIALASAGFVLWLFAGMIAHRLGTPLVRLEEVTRELGEGKLSSRARLGRHQPGEIGALARSINEMAERIERQVQGQRELLAGVSHEIRTPLARLRVITEILRDQQVDEKSLMKIEREIADIDDLTGQLLANSRLEFDNLEKRPLAPRVLARAALERANLTPDLLVVEGTEQNTLGDATLLERAMINLLENAKRHGGGLETFRVDFLKGSVRFSALDRGPGFVADDLSRVFEPFYRGSHSGKGGSSLGLGLSLVKRIARAHGGTAGAANRAHGGAEVYFEMKLESC